MAQFLLTACQVRMARAALRWSVQDLAQKSGISGSTIRRIEAVYGTPQDTQVSSLAALEQAFTAEGIVFLPDDGSTAGGPGIRFGKYPGRILRKAT